MSSPEEETGTLTGRPHRKIPRYDVAATVAEQLRKGEIRGRVNDYGRAQRRWDRHEMGERADLRPVIGSPLNFLADVARGARLLVASRLGRTS